MQLIKHKNTIVNLETVLSIEITPSNTMDFQCTQYRFESFHFDSKEELETFYNRYIKDFIINGDS
jgi:carbonic anhydrase